MANARQKEAYLEAGSCVVQAGPGSGKTATLTMKVMRLLNDSITPPRGIACLTFNNEALREYSKRLKRLGLNTTLNVFLGTVHSFCLSCVIKPFAHIYDSDVVYPIRVAPLDVQSAQLDMAIDEAGIKGNKWQVRKDLHCFRMWNLDRTSDEWTRNPAYASAIQLYESKIWQLGFIDFEGMILVAHDLLKEQELIRRSVNARFPWLVVDEYQDLGYPLHRIVNLLLDSTEMQILAVGDPDQSIYGFLGANPKYLRQLAERPDVTTITLDLNYRCGQRIIDGAEIVLSPENPRNYKASRGSIDPGEVHFIQVSEGLDDQCKNIVREILPKLFEAEFEPRQIAILYLDKYDGPAIMNALGEAEIPYSGLRDMRYQRTPITRWIEDVAEWCSGNRGGDGVSFDSIWSLWSSILRKAGRLSSEADTLIYMRHLITTLAELQDPDRKLSSWLNELDVELGIQSTLSLNNDWPSELEAFRELLRSTEGGLEDFNLADLANIGPTANKITVTTLHSSKGLQFDVVIIIGLEDGRLPHWGARTEGAIEEARRTFYVGFTRARFHVYLLYSGWYVAANGMKFTKGPSRFIHELMDELAE